MRSRLLAGEKPGCADHIALALGLGLSGTAWSGTDTLDVLARLSIEDLSNLRVTSVARQEQSLSDAPASIYVITRNDIRRAGVTSLPEALRLAPNLQVARTNTQRNNTTSQYAISARGFNNSVGNKLLVLIDGRTVYTPLYSGVFWEAQDVLLEDIDRIEVISGPGATLWGANAVNGIINIITRAADPARNALVNLTAGERERQLAVRQGGPFGNEGGYRVYAKRTEVEHTWQASGAAVSDQLDRSQAGFRTDWRQQQNAFTVQGDVYTGRIGETEPGKVDLSGLNLLGRWTHEQGDGALLQLQGYYDLTDRDAPGVYRDKMQILDLDLQHTLAARGRHQFLWGAGYRMARDEAAHSAMLAFLPADRGLHWATVFIQDEMSLRRNVQLTLGSKLESNSYTGTEFLPSLRLAWKATPTQLLWGEISRAVRAPARLDRDLYLLGGPNKLLGGPDFQSEISRIVELGYRGQYDSALSYSVTAFHHAHDKLRSTQALDAHTFVLANGIEGHTQGVEGWANYQVTPDWRLSAGLVELRQHLRYKQGATPIGLRGLGNDPEHTWQFRSQLDFGTRGEFDVMVRHVSALPDPAVPSYTAVDARLGWQLSPTVELSLLGQNLFDPRHAEFGSAATRSEYQRSALLKLIWRN